MDLNLTQNSTIILSGTGRGGMKKQIIYKPKEAINPET